MAILSCSDQFLHAVDTCSVMLLCYSQ